jgi:hypothetical protein
VPPKKTRKKPISESVDLINLRKYKKDTKNKRKREKIK